MRITLAEVGDHEIVIVGPGAWTLVVDGEISRGVGARSLAQELRRRCGLAARVSWALWPVAFVLALAARLWSSAGAVRRWIRWRYVCSEEWRAGIWFVISLAAGLGLAGLVGGWS